MVGGLLMDVINTYSVLALPGRARDLLGATCIYCHLVLISKKA